MAPADQNRPVRRRLPSVGGGSRAPPAGAVGPTVLPHLAHTPLRSPVRSRSAGSGSLRRAAATDPYVPPRIPTVNMDDTQQLRPRPSKPANSGGATYLEGAGSGGGRRKAATTRDLEKVIGTLNHREVDTSARRRETHSRRGAGTRHVTGAHVHSGSVMSGPQRDRMSVHDRRPARAPGTLPASAGVADQRCPRPAASPRRVPASRSHHPERKPLSRYGSHESAGQAADGGKESRVVRHPTTDPYHTLTPAHERWYCTSHETDITPIRRVRVRARTPRLGATWDTSAPLRTNPPKHVC
ncbi:hypothetical protein FRACA_220025 [Frankia canadensis]|uniref:Uncharacterized protein n=1 Tax=Frankia canadensis TaxID=1836972 RepID=A0A2I2KQZ0_9ACTN|nr:hypothetical protein FRACA_220025 [Frankia canadensis]SOU55375.1 hypothetical protein FRACA_220025 [Frankia canadensis]